MREHLREREWREIGRGYGDGIYEGLELGVCCENVAKIIHSISAVEIEMMRSDHEEEATRAELATGEGKASQQVKAVETMFDDPF